MRLKDIIRELRLRQSSVPPRCAQHPFWRSQDCQSPMLMQGGPQLQSGSQNGQGFPLP